MKIDPALKDQLQRSRSILVTGTAKLGDCIHTLPANRLSRAHAPKARVHVLASNLACPLLERCVDIDETLPMGVDHASGRATKRAARWRLMRRLFRSGFDVHLDFHPGADQTVLTTGLAGIGIRIGLNTRCGSARKPWFYDSFSDLAWQNQWLAQFFVDQLAALGLEGEVPPIGPAYLKPLDDASYAGLRPFIHVAPFASEGSRELLPEILEDTLLRLAAAHPGHRLAISAAPVPRELKALAALEARLKPVLGERLLSFAGTLDTGALAALIAKADLHLGCDSGTLHTAVLVGTPSVSWFLNHESITAWAPRSEGHTVLISAGEQSRSGKGMRGIGAEALGRAVGERLTATGGRGAARWQFVQPNANCVLDGDSAPR